MCVCLSWSTVFSVSAGVVLILGLQPLLVPTFSHQNSWMQTSEQSNNPSHQLFLYLCCVEQTTSECEFPFPFGVKWRECHFKHLLFRPNVCASFWFSRHASQPPSNMVGHRFYFFFIPIPKQCFLFNTSSSTSGRNQVHLILLTKSIKHNNL